VIHLPRRPTWIPTQRRRAGLDWLLAGRQAFRNSLGCCRCGGTPGTCIVGICATDCSNNPVVGAMVSVTPVGSGSGSSCTTTASPSDGCCQITLSAGAGNYNVTVSATGFSTLTQQMALSCSNIYTIALLPSPTTFCCTFSAIGCNGEPACNATVNIAGQTEPLPATICLTAVGSYPWTISAPTFNDATGTATITSLCGGCSGGAVDVELTPASGFQCCALGNLFPAEALPDTLFLTDSVYGGTTLTFDGVSSWVGSISGANVAAGCGCPDGGVTTIVYTVSCDGAGVGITYSVDIGDCPSETGTPGFIDHSIGPADITSCTFVLQEVRNPCGAGLPSVYPNGTTLTVTV
jgi:Carboxypeptidase regulatory-like domain